MISVVDASSSDKLEKIFSRNLTTIIKEAHPLASKQGIAIAYSGGIDSSVLLVLAAQFCQQANIPLFAFHIHHGLSTNADKWAAHCASQSAHYGAVFAQENVRVKKNGQGIEAAARQLRYCALGELCASHHISLVLTGHHLDDQAETILMQLLRGTGLAGMAGMDAFNYAPTLLHQRDVLLGRPLLNVSKQELVDYAKINVISNIEDESNLETHYTRNALRHLAMPMLEEIAPGYIHRLTRMGQHARDSLQILQDLAQDDFNICGSKECLYVDALAQLSFARINQVLRYWLNLHQVKMPSTAKLTEMRTQLLESRSDAQVTVSHDGIDLHRYANELYIVKHKDKSKFQAPEIHIQWQGEAKIYLANYQGTLHFDSSDIGIDKDTLSSLNLCIKPRSGGEKIRLASNRPTRSIKSHCQTMRIPFWQRSLLPCIFVDNVLMYVAAIGIDAQFLKQEQDNLIAITWHPEDSKQITS